MDEKWIDYLVNVALDLIDEHGTATESDLIARGASRQDASRALDLVGRMDGYEVIASRKDAGAA